MDSPTFEQAVAFGPFRMPHLQEQVNDRMRQAFYSYLSRGVLPLLEGQVTRIEGRVFSHYDRPEFLATDEVKHRYYYELRLSSVAGVEHAWGEVDYDPDTTAYTPSRIKPPGVKTLSEVRRDEEACQAELEFQKRNAQHPGDCCPKCHSKQVARILYGLYPVPLPASVRAEVQAGRSCLGGCCIDENSPRWRCLACGSTWGRLSGVGEILSKFLERRSDEQA